MEINGNKKIFKNELKKKKFFYLDIDLQIFFATLVDFSFKNWFIWMSEDLESKWMLLWIEILVWSKIF